MIELQLSAIPSVVIEHINKCYDWIWWIYLINPIPWFDLISSILWFDLISSILWSNLIQSDLLIWFNYFYLTIIPFTSLCKLVKDASNHIPEEYDWLGPDLTQNTKEWYNPIFSVAVLTLTPRVHKPLNSYLLLANYSMEVIIICICSILQRATSTPPPHY